MTTFRSTDVVAAETVTAAIAAVRSHGLRVSTSRRMVLEALFGAGVPVSADRIATGLGGRLPPLDLASVYRNLDTLEQLGVVRHFHAGHGAGLYTLAGHDRREYLVCDGCGTVRAVDVATLDPVRAALRDSAGWDARFTHFPIVGSCPACTDRGV
jgi:Fur family transcriptional regulator, ferric uptake regulator